MDDSQEIKDDKAALLNAMEKHLENWLKMIKAEQGVVTPLTIAELPGDTVLRLLYNEAYFCTHAGLGLAGVMLQTALLERLTRDIYKKLVKEPIPEHKIDWHIVLEEIEKELTAQNLIKEADAVKITRWVKDEAKRNKYHHVEIEGILKGVKQPGVRLDVKTGEMIKGDFDASLFKPMEAHYVEFASVMRALQFLPYVSAVVKILYPLKTKLESL